jgi:Bacterial archaeo-eukaryotic release factor family 3
VLSLIVKRRSEGYSESPHKLIASIWKANTHMICRSELKRIQSHNDYPSISLLAPTHRTSPANKRDRIVVKNLAAKGLERLHGEFKKREVASVVQNLNKLINQVDWMHTLEGLALFAGKDEAIAVYLPFKVKARFVIDATFATRDLLFTLNRAPRYRVLVLTEKPARLFEATTNVLTEITEKPFPMVHVGPGGASKLPGGQGINRSAVRDESHRQFFTKVDDALAAIQKEDPLPVVVVGVDRYLAFYQEVTKNPDAIVGLVAGSHDDPKPSALGKLVWPVFKAGATLRRTRALMRLNEAVSLNRHASGIDQVWRAAHENRCQTLLVETDFEYPADLAPDGDRLLPYTGRGAAALDDAVDEVIENVVAKGGEVFFYEPGVLDLHQQIAAVLRY